MILGKPVIFFDTAGYYKMFEANRLFIERCAFALAEDNDRFIALFERYLNDAAADADRQKQAVFDCAFKQDGEASQRVADVINAALDKG
jgi:pyridoxine/pyridoxamine 5'-phosphate oxidase